MFRRPLFSRVALSKCAATAAAGLVVAAPPLPLNSNSIPMFTSMRYMTSDGAQAAKPSRIADATTSASIVVVDPAQAAKERDRLARELLASNLPPEPSKTRRVLTTVTGVVHTVPYSLQVVVVQHRQTSIGDAMTPSPAADASQAASVGLVQQRVKESVEAVLSAAFKMVDEKLNHFNKDSEISKVNLLGAGEKHTMSPELKAVLACCVQVFRISGASFNPASLKMTEMLRDAVVKNIPPSELSSKIENIIEDNMLNNAFEINLEAGTIARLHGEAALDLGSLNKGYTVDYVVDGLNKLGFDNVLFEWGGDCRASGTNVQGQPWVVGVYRPPTLEEIHESVKAQGLLDKKDGPGTPSFSPPAESLTSEGTPAVRDETEQDAKPEESGSASSDGASQQQQQQFSGSNRAENRPLLRVMHLRNEAIATSGDYENLVYGSEYGVRCSTFDWKEQQLIEPSDTRLAQVTVKSYSAMYADALATAALAKRDAVKVRYLLENYRRSKYRVTDYAAYTRKNERLAHMYEIAHESSERRKERISGSLPARVVVIGGGLAGQSAAIEAANCGAQVVLIEKADSMGGNSAKATSGINGWGTRAQAVNDIYDDCKFFERDTHKSGLGGTSDPGLVRMLSVKSADAIEWLTSFGIPLTVLSQLGGHSRKRTHRAPDTKEGTPVPIGYTIMKTLEQYIREKLPHQVTVMTNTSVVNLLHEEHPCPDGTCDMRVTGVEYESQGMRQKLLADAVVLATGGFSNDQTNSSLLREYAPQLFGRPTTNGTFATGDGVKLARRIGASLVDMDKVQLHPTGLIDPKCPANKTKYLGPEALRGSGGILLNKNGERFVNELDLRSVVSEAINNQDTEYPESRGCLFAYCVLSQQAANLFGVNSLEFYWKHRGLFQYAEDVPALAKLIGCDEFHLRKELETYQTLSTAKTTCPTTGKMVFPSVVGTTGPYYVACVTPSIHYTMGGCLISSSAEILHKTASDFFDDMRPILGLYGAGEVTGGVHGRNRLGGNSLLECVVFGKVAGDRAATILQKRQLAFAFDTWTPVLVSEVRSGEQYGTGSRVLRFNLPGSLQLSGLSVGEFISIRGEWDGQQLIGYYSPITLPEDHGRISILARGDKGNLSEWISALRPGDSVEMRACGGLRITRDPKKRQLLHGKRVIRKFGLIAGGTGVAPMLQVVRAALQRPYVDSIDAIRLIYAAEDVSELTYRDQLRHFTKENADKLQVEMVLNNPPEGWTGGVGFVEKTVLQQVLPPPSTDLLIAICGPAAMQRSVVSDLLALGYPRSVFHTVDGEMK